MQENLPAEVAIHKESNLASVFELANDHFKNGDLEQALNILEEALKEARKSNDGEWTTKFNILHSTLSFNKRDNDVRQTLRKAKKEQAVFKYETSFQLYAKARRELEELYKLGRNERQLLKRKASVDKAIIALREKAKESGVILPPTADSITEDPLVKESPKERPVVLTISVASAKAEPTNQIESTSLKAVESSLASVNDKITLIESKNVPKKAKIEPIPALKPPKITSKPQEKQGIIKEKVNEIQPECNQPAVSEVPKKSGVPTRLTKPVVPAKKNTSEKTVEPSKIPGAKPTIAILQNSNQKLSEKTKEVQNFENESNSGSIEDLTENQSKNEVESVEYSSETQKHIAIRKEQYTENKVQEYTKKLASELKELGFTIIRSKSASLVKISKIADILAAKVFNLSNTNKILMVLPIKMLNLKGNVTISEKDVNYIPNNANLTLTNALNNVLIGSTANAMNLLHDIVFKAIVSQSGLFKALRKYLRVKLSLETTYGQRRLFFRDGSVQYNVIIEPMAVSLNEVNFKEGIVPFPYLRSNNVHYIQINQISQLIDHLEFKYSTIENHQKKESSLASYIKESDRFLENVKRASLVVFTYGVLCLFLMLFQIFAILNLLISIGYALACVYFLVLAVLYFKYYFLKSNLSKEFNTPYYKRKLTLDDDELLAVCEGLSDDMLNQFYFECFGKISKMNQSILAIDEKEQDDVDSHQVEGEYVDSEEKFVVIENKDGPSKKTQSSKEIAETEGEGEIKNSKSVDTSNKERKENVHENLEQKYKKYFE